MDTPSLVSLLGSHPLLKGLTPAQLAEVASCARVQTLAPNEFLAREGDVANAVMLLQSGRLSLEIHTPGRGDVAVETFRGGDVLGWSTLFPPFVWHLDTRAVEPSTVIHLEATQLSTLLQADAALGYTFTHRLLGEVSRRLARARLQQLDVYKAEHR